MPAVLWPLLTAEERAVRGGFAFDIVRLPALRASDPRSRPGSGRIEYLAARTHHVNAVPKMRRAEPVSAVSCYPRRIIATCKGYIEMAERPEGRLPEPKMDANALYREEIYTDRQIGTIRAVDSGQDRRLAR